MLLLASYLVLVFSVSHLSLFLKTGIRLSKNLALKSNQFLRISIKQSTASNCNRTRKCFHPKRHSVDENGEAKSFLLALSKTSFNCFLKLMSRDVQVFLKLEGDEGTDTWWFM